MPEAYVRRGSGLAPNQSNKGNANTVRVDSATDVLKFGTGTSGTTEKDVVDTSSTQTLTGKTFTSPVLTTPAVAQINDTAGQARALFNTAAKTIVDGSATALFSVAVAAGTHIGGFGTFLIRTSDGTDHQAIAGIFDFAAVAKLTAVTATITYVAANEAKAVSSGTLTLAFTADATVNNVVTYKLQPTGSLTETTYTIEYALFPTRGVVTIL